MKNELKLYDHDLRVPMLELSDNHTWWQITNPLIDEEIFYFYVDFYLELVRSHYKNLEIHLCGRSGRHVCIEDTPQNRKRYFAIQKRLEKAENEMIVLLNGYTEEKRKLFKEGKIA